jgi:hypothetical protein
MFARSLILAGALLVPFAIACTSGNDGTTGDDQNVTARPGELNGFCGGIAGISCKAGLKCVHADGEHPDAAGKCDAVATCLAMPSCGTGEKQVEKCSSDVGCSAVSMCGKSIFCKKEGGVVCQAEPTCAPGDTRVEKCSSDTGCSAVSMCGKSIFCEKPSTDVTLEGTLIRSVGIGGENTGFSILTAQGQLELVLDSTESSQFVDQRFARVKGKRVTLTGVEIATRSALDVTDLLVCPSSSAVINCMPPLAPSNKTCGENRSFIESKCTGVSFVE